ncbi:MAG: 3-hydroxyacyl-ACP dehydratase FabZ [Eubacteriales bacterium]
MATLNSNEIQKIIPHRYPFLLVDRITDYEPGKFAIGLKGITANEMYFLGHFPEHHVMPGVLIIEALAQVGAVAILSVPENQGKIALFRGINQCKFKKQVVPGDTLTLECILLKQRGIVGVGKATASVNGEIVARTELTFAIVQE